MTLRARLTAGFLAVVLGPVLLGALFVGGTVTTVTKARAAERLDLAAAGVRTAVGALCQHLRGTAQMVGVLTAAGSNPDAARVAVQGGLVSAVHLENSAGQTIATSPNAPAPPWVYCSSGEAPATTTEQSAVADPGDPSTPIGSEPSTATSNDTSTPMVNPPAQPTGLRYTAIAARVEMRGSGNKVVGYAYAAQVLTPDLLARLAASSGADVSVIPMTADGAAQPGLSAEDRTLVDRARTAAAGKNAGVDGRLVRRLDPESGQPLTLALAVDSSPPGYLYTLLIGLVLVAGLVAVAAAWWLARSTTRPLAELSTAVEALAAGDLEARVPVRTQDEVGRLADRFNRMTREMRGYVHALTTSRDQLRSNLGVLGATLSSTHDLPRMLEVILRSAVAATGAQAGVVLLADPDTGQLIAACGEGLADRVGDPDNPDDFSTGQLKLGPGQGLLGLVAATGDARRGRVDRDGPELDEAEPRCRTYVVVPFAAGQGLPLADRPELTAPTGPAAGGLPASDPGEPEGGCHGVLALYDRHGQDEFDDADLVTLQTFAGQAAVAVDNVRIHEEAQRLSLTDPLTGLWNYRYLRESLRREVERASRFGRTLCVLAMDLDRFKEINDSHGHAAGDAVLVEFARRIRQETREVDLLFRQGGEEFVVLLPETDARGGIVVAERLGAAIRDTPIEVAGHAPVPIAVTVSIGIAVFPHHAATGAQVLEAADDALYAAKAAGRSTYRLATTTRTGIEPFFVASQPRPDGEYLPGVSAPVTAGGGASAGSHPPRQARGD